MVVGLRGLALFGGRCWGLFGYLCLWVGSLRLWVGSLCLSFVVIGDVVDD